VKRSKPLSSIRFKISKKNYRAAFFVSINKEEDFLEMKKIMVIFVLFTASVSAFSGDVATYVNLGFSKDSNMFMFGQYGIREGDMKVYADIYTVDVKNNVFVRDGVREKVFPDAICPGQDGMGGLLMLLHDASDIVSRYKINHITTGRVVYILVDGKVPKERLEFRDFNRGNSFVLTLVQERFGKGKETSSSFHINVAVTDRNGNTRAFMAGLPNYQKGRGFPSYRIKQVVFNSD